MNFEKVKKVISEHLEKHALYYPKELFDNISFDVNSGSFGACLVSLKNDFNSISCRYVGNYEQLELLISDFIHKSYNNLTSRFYEQNKAVSSYCKVEQLYNKNQFVCDTNYKRYFQSYNSLIAVYDKASNRLTLGSDWDYSNTTRKHLYLFIDEYCYLNNELDKTIKNSKNKRKTIQKAIENGAILYDSNMQ